LQVFEMAVNMWSKRPCSSNVGLSVVSGSAQLRSNSRATPAVKVHLKGETWDPGSPGPKWIPQRDYSTTCKIPRTKTSTMHFWPKGPYRGPPKDHSGGSRRPEARGGPPGPKNPGGPAGPNDTTQETPRDSQQASVFFNMPTRPPGEAPRRPPKSSAEGHPRGRHKLPIKYTRFVQNPRPPKE